METQVRPPGMHRSGSKSSDPDHQPVNHQKSETNRRRKQQIYESGGSNLCRRRRIREERKDRTRGVKGRRLRPQETAEKTGAICRLYNERVSECQSESDRVKVAAGLTRPIKRSQVKQFRRELSGGVSHASPLHLTP